MIVAAVFKMAVAAFALLGLCFFLWGLFLVRRRTGGKFPRERRDFDALRRSATSRWDPFGDVGIRRWYLIMLLLFGVLMLINVMGW
jgi:hypothetical protein